MARPSTSIVAVSGSTTWPSVARRPSTWTRPAAISSSLARRDATPAAARTFWSRSGGIGLRGRLGWRFRSVRGRVGPGFLVDEPRRELDVERRELDERREPEPLEEVEPGPVQKRPAGRLGPPELHDEPSMEERADRVVGIDAADPLDRRLRDRLAVGDDRERLHRGR